jgi:hypothetical protein
MRTAAWDAWTERARAVRIEDVTARRGIKLNGKAGKPSRCGPCPRCGGDDRFAIHIGKQAFHCRRCGGKGSGTINLVMWLDGVDFIRAVETLAGDRREPVTVVRKPIEVSTTEPTDEENRQSALRMFREAGPLAGTMGEHYLTKRGIDLAEVALPDVHGVLRFHGACPFKPGQRKPCIIALFRSATTDQPLGIQRIAIAPDLTKIGRLSFGPIGNTGVIKLWPDAHVEQGLVIGEGLETTLSGAMVKHRGAMLRPAWATGGTVTMSSFPVLNGIEALTILVDHDRLDERTGKRPGEDAARKCAERWLDAGREVLRLVPKQLGDFNDILREGAAS